MRTNLAELKTFLQSELERRLSQKPGYSKRAFARDIGLSVTALNEFLADKRVLSFANVNRVFEYLNRKIHCSWCDRAKQDVKFLIGGPRRQFICDRCLDRCGEIKQTNRLMD